MGLERDAPRLAGEALKHPCSLLACFLWTACRVTPERLGHLRPRPAVPQRPLDLRVLHLVCEPPLGDGGGEAVRGVFGVGEVGGSHGIVSNLS